MSNDDASARSSGIAAIIAAGTPLRAGQPWGIGIPDTFIAPCAVCGDPNCYAHPDRITALEDKVSAYANATRLAYQALDFILDQYDADDGPPPQFVLDAHAALYGLLGYQVETDGGDLPF